MDRNYNGVDRMEPITGLEPVTSSLPRKCSTAELYGQRDKHQPPDTQPAHLLERVMGIEPTSLAWKAKVLPLNYTRVLLKTWWRGEDLNLRRLSRQIYSLIPLTTREPLQSGSDAFCH